MQKNLADYLCGPFVFSIAVILLSTNAYITVYNENIANSNPHLLHNNFTININHNLQHRPQGQQGNYILREDCVNINNILNCESMI